MIAGVDTHKDTLAVAVIDDAGRVITRRQVPNDDGGYVRLSGLLAGHDVRRVGIEGSGLYGWPAHAARPAAPTVCLHFVEPTAELGVLFTVEVVCSVLPGRPPAHRRCCADSRSGE